MTLPTAFLIEGVDGVGKDTLIDQLLQRLGHHLVLHYKVPPSLTYYQDATGRTPERQYQEDSFRTLFKIVRSQDVKVIANRTHLGEVVYAPRYRKYPGDYVYSLEEEFAAKEWKHVRVLLLTEDFSRSTHYVDDQKSLGPATLRPAEQQSFLEALQRSSFPDKRVLCVTDPTSGAFKRTQTILDEALA